MFVPLSSPQFLAPTPGQSKTADEVEESFMVDESRRGAHRYV